MQKSYNSGEQISPQAVDDVLLDHRAVQIAVTFGVRNALYGEEVASAVVLADGQTANNETRDSILEHAKQHLQPFEVPKQLLFVKVDEIPKGRTGKYLRNKVRLSLTIFHQIYYTYKMSMAKIVCGISQSRISRQRRFGITVVSCAASPAAPSVGGTAIHHNLSRVPGTLLRCLI